MVFEILTDRAKDLAGRELHALRDRRGRLMPQIVRDDGAAAWRAALQRNTASARRIHFWRCRTDRSSCPGLCCTTTWTREQSGYGPLGAASAPVNMLPLGPVAGVAGDWTAYPTGIEPVTTTRATSVVTGRPGSMGLSVQMRYVYDDVALIVSTDLEASRWKLEVLVGDVDQWQPVPAKVTDAHMNWSTADLELWDELRGDDESVVERVFPDADETIPARRPFAVMWNISSWYDRQNPSAEDDYRFRFTAPSGSEYEFTYPEMLRGAGNHVFG